MFWCEINNISRSKGQKTCFDKMIAILNVISIYSNIIVIFWILPLGAWRRRRTDWWEIERLVDISTAILGHAHSHHSLPKVQGKRLHPFHVALNICIKLYSISYFGEMQLWYNKLFSNYIIFHEKCLDQDFLVFLRLWNINIRNLEKN